MFRLRSSCPLLFTLMLFSTQAGGAIQVTSGEVPMDLVTALLSGQQQGAQIFVGELPPDAEEWFPLGQSERVVGGLARRSGGTVIVEVLGTAPAALSTFNSYLQEQGWQRPSIPQDLGGGFQSTPRSNQTTWCGEDYSIQSSSSSFDSGTYLRVRYTRLEGARTVCNREVIAALGATNPFGLRLPSLEAPQDAVVTSSGGGSNSSNRDTEATLQSDLPSTLIFEHYARQFTAAGWVPEGQTISEGVSIGRWLSQDDEGRPVIGVLAVWGLTAPNSHQAWARVDRPGSRR